MVEQKREREVGKEDSGKGEERGTKESRTVTSSTFSTQCFDMLYDCNDLDRAIFFFFCIYTIVANLYA